MKPAAFQVGDYVLKRSHKEKLKHRKAKFGKIVGVFWNGLSNQWYYHVQQHTVVWAAMEISLEPCNMNGVRIPFKPLCPIMEENIAAHLLHVALLG